MPHRDDHTHLTDETGAFDLQMEQFARHVAQRTSRRSIISWVGRLILGGAVVPLLPWDRQEQTAEAAASCSSWHYCGLNGRPCASCSGGSDTQCPSGCTAGSSWRYCCKACSTCCGCYVTYRDCCGCTPSCSLSCSNSSEPNWCGSAGAYGCTLAIVGSVCASGGNCPC